MSQQADLSAISFRPVGIVHSCFKEKFGIPRQPGLATAARAELELLGDCANMDTVRGLEQCSHIWVLFLFSEHLQRSWTPLVRPPRSQLVKTGAKMGVFATRSTFRPNPIGMSVVRLDGIEQRDGKPVLLLSGIDILDGTPVVDIKPYLPYADNVAEAENSYAPEPPAQLPVKFSELAHQQLAAYPETLARLIVQVLAADPRPVHLHKQTDREYGIQLEMTNIRWRVQQQHIEVIAIEPL